MSGETPRVHLLATGGTIANPDDIDGYLDGAQLVADVPEVSERADVSVTDVSSIGSQAMTPAIWYELHDAITTLAASDDPPDGVVITQGSNTVEETAYFLHLTVAADLPVVLTAAQRNHGLVGNDGDRNLVDAVRVAVSPAARGRGAMVVLNDEIHCARDVTKVVSGRPDAWSSDNLGVLGLLDKRDNLRFYRRSERQHGADTPFDLAGTDPESFPTVEIVYAAAGVDGTLVRAAADAGVDGLVLAAMPTGAPAKPAGVESQAEALDDVMADSLPVVLSHRGFSGWPYPREPYIWGDTLTPQKARVLLALALLHTTDRDEIQRCFETY